MAKLNKIKISGTTYDVGGSNVIELTQAEYDALVDIDPTALYVITDATEVDINDYYKKSETSGKTEISTALSGKQDTLVSGTNIKTVNNESILGSGNIDIQGGKELVGGTNISVSTGATADTIDCTLPISGDSKGIYTTSSYPFLSNSMKSKNAIFGEDNQLDVFGATRTSNYNLMFGSNNRLTKYGSNILVGGRSNSIGSPNTAIDCSVLLGYENNVTQAYETALGRDNITTYVSSSSFGDSGNTLFTVGNGNGSNTRHNAIDIRQSGDIYVPDTDDTTSQNYYEKPMLRLQDYMRKKPVVLYLTDGTTGLLGLNESSYGTNNYQLENMDFTPYKYLKCYIKPSVDTVADSAKSPAVVVEVPLDDAASSGSYFMGGQEVLYPFNRNRHFACGIAVDPTKTKLKFVYEVTLWDISTSDANAAADGRYLYKIVGYYD